MSSVAILLLMVTLFALVIGKANHKDPLEQFPGPWLAKWTWIYRAYYDIVVGGGWLSHLQKLHERYGPVVRVGHDELHFAEPSAYVDIYSSFPVHRKDPKFYSTFSLTAPSTFAEMDPKEHAIIRGMIAPFFSRKSVLSLEYVIQEQTDQLIQQLLQNHRTLPADMDLAFRSVTLDIITLYTFGISINAVKTPRFQHPVSLNSEKHVRNKWFFKHFPRIKRLMVYFPSWFAAVIGRKASFSFVQEITTLVDDALNHEDRGSGSQINKNIYHTLLSDSTPMPKKTDRLNRRWLIGEGLNLRGAGSDTVSNTCTIGARYVLSDKRVLRKLQHELDTAWQDKDDRFPLERLEKLPYLTAVIKESLRLGHGVVTPMPRIVPETGSIIAGYHVPAGTSVAVGNIFVHMNPVVFPNPTRFYPERWLEDHHKVERYLVTFGKGSRSCLGITLAWCELYLIFGNLFRKLDLFAINDIMSTLHIQDYFVPCYGGETLKVVAVPR